MLTWPGLGPFCSLHRLISLYLHLSLLGTSIPSGTSDHQASRLSPSNFTWVVEDHIEVLSKNVRCNEHARCRLKVFISFG